MRAETMRSFVARPKRGRRVWVGALALVARRSARASSNSRVCTDARWIAPSVAGVHAESVRGELSHVLGSGRLGVAPELSSASMPWIRSRMSAAWLLATVVVLGCGDSTSSEPDGGSPTTGTGGSAGGGPADAPVDTGATTCPVPAPTACPSPPVRFPAVEPILQQRCQTCHDGKHTEDGGPNGLPVWALVEFSHIVDWQDLIRADLMDCSMPPADAGPSLTVEERTALLTWVRCGALP